MSRGRRPIGACPLEVTWRAWSFGDNFKVPRAAREAVESNRRLRPGHRIAGVDVDWVIAPDDASILPAPPPDLSFGPGSPRHRHTEWRMDRVTIHVDELSANMWAPGRAYLEYRIFSDGALIGRGGQFGCSLGAGGSDLPARALLPTGELLIVKAGGLAERWTAMAAWLAREMERTERRQHEEWMRSALKGGKR